MKGGSSVFVPLRQHLRVLFHQVLQESQVALVGQLRRDTSGGVRRSAADVGSPARRGPHLEHTEARQAGVLILDHVRVTAGLPGHLSAEVHRSAGCGRGSERL